jgi:hypothetical protein
MSTKRPTFSRRKRWAIAATLLAMITAVSTYGDWGYERHLAVESFPAASAEINPEFQFAIVYHKRFNWLPGARLTLVAVDRDDIAEIRGSAVTAYDWSMPDLRGTTYCFIRDIKPLPGWTKRDPMAERVTHELN